jgi:hypothetical protein
MLANFKKIGVAAAVATAIGASGAAQAITLGEPGGALLVPHVIFDSKTQVNTMIGVTVGDEVPPGQFPTVQGKGSECSGSNKTLHWYFFNTRSVHLADGTVRISCNDFSRFDWGFVITNPSRPFPSLDGVAGYLVLSSNDARSDSTFSSYTLYGSAYLIQGDWASEAYIPVLPLRDAAGGVGDEVTYKGGIPSDVNPLLAGMPLAHGVAEAARFSLRYFVDPTPLNGNTRFVLWFPDNSGQAHGDGRIDRSAVAIDVYDADEVAVSSTLSLPDELNIVNANSIDGTVNDPTGHAIPDLASGQPALDSGFVLFHLADTSNTKIGPEYSRAGIAFSLIGLGSSVDSVQVQTDLAHERGIVPSF